MKTVSGLLLCAALVLCAHSSALAQNESFDAITALTPPTVNGTITASGWVGALRSTNAAAALTGIFQGNLAVFPQQEGTGYMGMNFNNTTGTNTISTWAMSPVINMQNGDTYSFYTRTVDAPAFPDRLEVRRSGAGASTNVGATANDVGDFTNLLQSVNPGLTVTGYPNVWTQFSGTISGLAGPTSGRLAFRYFVTAGGPSGANSDYIGIDNFRYTPIPEPTACLTAVVGLIGLAIRRRTAA